MKLHLGCGDIRLAGWLNVDVRECAGGDVICDLVNLAPICGEGEADAVYACHVLEHFGFGCVYPGAQGVLEHWVSRLKPGGHCYLSVPDLRVVGAALANAENPRVQFDLMRCLYGGCEYPQNRHFIGFTYALLQDMMQQAGLGEIIPFASFAPDTSRFNLHGHFVSLNLRGTRA